MKLLKFWLILVMVCGLSSCYETAPPPPSGIPTTETTNTKSSSIGVNGGKISSTASNGITYTLIIPPNALTETKTITLTPISSMGNAPLAAGVTAAVQMEPSGLTFKRSATLKIPVVPTVASGKKLIGFSTKNDGSQFGLTLPTVKNGVTELSIDHFSDAGVGTATLAEIDAIPDIAPIETRTEDDYKNLVFSKALNGDTAADIAVEFQRWFKEIIKAKLLAAKDSTDDAVKVEAQFAFEHWFDARARMAELVEGSINVEPFLTTEDALARPIVAKIALGFIDAKIAACSNAVSAEDKLVDLFLVFLEHRIGVDYRLDTLEFGLDLDSFLKKVNACARVVIDPFFLPSNLIVGSDKSLNARARLIYAGIPDPQDAAFEFSLTPTNATLKNNSGFSDGQGRFTAVFTPATLAVGISVKACLFLGEVTDLCVTQDALIPDGIFRGTLNVAGHLVSTNNNPPKLTLSETKDFTLEAEIGRNPLNGSQLIRKNATVKIVIDNDNTGLEGTIDCSNKVHHIVHTTETGSSTIILPNDIVNIGVTSGTTYTIGLNSIQGDTLVQGTETKDFSSGTCIIEPFTTTSTINRKTTNNYQSNTFSQVPVITDTLISNPDGSSSMVGSKVKTVSGVTDSGFNFTNTYTFSWNLTAH